MNRRFGSAWGLPEIGRIPDMCHTFPSVANFVLCRPEKENSQLLKTLVPRPTSHRKWVGEPVYGLANSGITLKVFALDCETVNTTTDKELAWVTLLDFNRDTCYDTFVKPLADIVDYTTNYSAQCPRC